MEPIKKKLHKKTRAGLRETKIIEEDAPKFISIYQAAEKLGMCARTLKSRIIQDDDLRDDLANTGFSLSKNKCGNFIYNQRLMSPRAYHVLYCKFILTT